MTPPGKKDHLETQSEARASASHLGNARLSGGTAACQDRLSAQGPPFCS